MISVCIRMYRYMQWLMLLLDYHSFNGTTATKLHGNLSLQQREFILGLNSGRNCHLM